MRLSLVLKTLGYLALGCHALVVPADSTELEIEIKIKGGADAQV